MAMITIGLVLIALGLRGYFSAGRVSLTAWIPAFFGLPLLKLGLVALEERRRKVANHIGVVLGLLGVRGDRQGSVEAARAPERRAGRTPDRVVGVQSAMASCALSRCYCASGRSSRLGAPALRSGIRDVDGTRLRAFAIPDSREGVES